MSALGYSLIFLGGVLIGYHLRPDPRSIALGLLGLTVLCVGWIAVQWPS